MSGKNLKLPEILPVVCNLFTPVLVEIQLGSAISEGTARSTLFIVRFLGVFSFVTNQRIGLVVGNVQENALAERRITLMFSLPESLESCAFHNAYRRTKALMASLVLWRLGLRRTDGTNTPRKNLDILNVDLLQTYFSALVRNCNH